MIIGDRLILTEKGNRELEARRAAAPSDTQPEKIESSDWLSELEAAIRLANSARKHPDIEDAYCIRMDINEGIRSLQSALDLWRVRSDNMGDQV